MHFEGISGAINVSVVAFSIVFGVLIVLTGTIYAMRLFSGSSDGEKKNDIGTKPVTPAPAKPVQITANAPVMNIDKAKIVAAITAAIVEFTGSTDFRILSVEADRAGVSGNHSRWKTAGMLSLNSNRLNRKWH